jgi:molybdopterin-guanine dinucleotide biosynthesis protein A
LRPNAPVSPSTSVAILIGGEGRRLGGVAKHRLAFADGETVLARLALLLAETIGPVTLVSRSPVDLPLPVLLDTYADAGPAAGLHTALVHASTPWVFVASCDLPLLDAGTIGRLAAARGESSVVLARAGGRLQPLAAFWHRRALPEIERALGGSRPGAPGVDKRGPSLHGLVAALDATIVDLDDATPFTNVNRPEDLAALGLVLLPEPNR